jgi:hypothetical protein
MAASLPSIAGRFFERPTFRLDQFRRLMFITYIAAITYEVRRWLAQEMNPSFGNATQSPKSEWRQSFQKIREIECVKSDKLSLTTLPKTRNKQYA